jgi:hypothetical protein
VFAVGFRMSVVKNVQKTLLNPFTTFLWLALQKDQTEHYEEPKGSKVATFPIDVNRFLDFLVCPSKGY